MIIMKWHSMFAFEKSASCGLLLGLMIVGSASAQNLLNNPGFEAPIATSTSVLTNWSVKYSGCLPEDFCIRDRSTFANHAGTFGGHFRPVTEGTMHAYFTQYAVGLTPGDTYVVSGWMMNTWESGATGGKINIFIETIGGLGSVSTPTCTSASSTWTFYSVTNTAKANTTLEVRLHYDKPSNTVITDNKGLNNASGCWDDISVTHQ
jgi:hypothetical protein